MLPGNSAEDQAHQRWYDNNEDSLLSNFIDEYVGVVPIPMVKDWTKPIEDLFNDYVEKQWESYKDESYD